MNKQTFIFIAVAVVLGAVIGLLLRPVLFGEKMEPPIVIPVAPDSSFMSGAPDTVWREAEIIYKPRYVYQDTGSVRTIVDTQWVAIKRTVINSYKHFDHGDFVTSEVWTKSRSEVFNISNAVVVDWQDHYEAEYLPQIKIQLKDTQKFSLLKGAAAGAIVAAGLMSGDWRIAAASAAAGVGIVIIF